MALEKDGEDQVDKLRKNKVLRRSKEKRNILRTMQQGKANWIARIFLSNCFLKHVIQGKIGVRIKVTGRRERRCVQLLHDLKERRMD
jgi:hypothetical protein